MRLFRSISTTVATTRTLCADDTNPADAGIATVVSTRSRTPFVRQFVDMNQEGLLIRDVQPVADPQPADIGQGGIDVDIREIAARTAHRDAIGGGIDRGDPNLRVNDFGVAERGLRGVGDWWRPARTPPD